MTDRQQIIYALERAAARLDAERDKLMAFGDYSAEFPGEDAERMREAIEILKSPVPTDEAALADAERFRKLQARFAGTKTSASQNFLDALGIEDDPTDSLTNIIDRLAQPT